MKNTLKLIALIMVSVFTAFAAIEGDFYQYDASAFTGEQRDAQPWLGAQMISMHVTGGNSVWLASYINSWYWPKPVADLNGSMFQMGAGQYGYILKSELDGADPASDYSNLIHWADGRTKEITYVDTVGGSGLTNKGTAYYLDYFGEDDDIYFVMTALAEDSGEVVDSYQLVNSATSPTTLASRVDGTKDISGNVRINFGFTTTDDGREFVSFWSQGDYNGETPEAPSGQPLPGAFVASMLAFGSVFAGKKLKKN